MNPWMTAVPFWLVFFAFVWAFRVIAEGRRRWLADRSHPIRALERIAARGTTWNR